MTPRRVFANNNNIDYIDYYAILSGQAMYKNIKSKGSNQNDVNYKVYKNEIIQFLDYQTFLNISRAFFRQYGPVQTSFYAPYSINDAKTSFLCYRQLLSHIKDCDYCNKCKNISKICDCKDVQNILYPYGNMVSTNYSNDYSDKDFKFPIKLQLFSPCLECNNNCNGECKKIVPICSEYSNNEIGKRGCIDKCAKKCNDFNCYNPCEIDECETSCGTPCDKKKNYCNVKNNKNICFNNVYPSQHQFMYHKGNNESNIDFEISKRTNAYAVYPQIKKTFLSNTCHTKNVCNKIEDEYKFTHHNDNKIPYFVEKKIGLGIYPQIPLYSCYNNPTCGTYFNNKCKSNYNNKCINKCNICPNTKPLFT